MIEFDLRSMRSLIAAGIAAAVTSVLSGCAPQFSYSPPTGQSPTLSVKSADLPFDEAWNRIIAKAGRTFFVINNLERASGFINLSYSGDPHEFLDCGELRVKSQNIEGQGDSQHEVARETQNVHARTGINVDTYIRYDMHLEGRANIVLQKVSERTVRLETTVRYIVKRRAQFLSGYSPLPPGIDDTTSFNSGQMGVFSSRIGGEQVRCVSTGKFETTLLSLLD